MTVAPVYKQGWTMEDIHWSLFDPSKVDPQPAVRDQGGGAGGI